jgi:hypothetical protein
MRHKCIGPCDPCVFDSHPTHHLILMYLNRCGTLMMTMKPFSQFLNESTFTPIKVFIKGRIAWYVPGSDDEEKEIPFALRGNSILAIAKAIAAKLDASDAVKPDLYFDTITIHSNGAGGYLSFDGTKSQLLNDVEWLMWFLIGSYSHKFKDPKAQIHVKIDLDFSDYRDEYGRVTGEYDGYSIEMEPHVVAKSPDELAKEAHRAIMRVQSEVGDYQFRIHRITVLGEKGYGSTGSADYSHASEPIVIAVIAAGSDLVSV